MGSNRRKHQDKQKAEIFSRLSLMFDVSEKELFEVWSDYVGRKKMGFAPRLIAHIMRHKSGVFAAKKKPPHSERALNYFMAVGLELFSRTYLEVEDGKKMDIS